VVAHVGTCEHLLEVPQGLVAVGRASTCQFPLNYPHGVELMPTVCRAGHDV